MANCTVRRNNQGVITTVKTTDGIESQLFNSIASHPLIENSEIALNIYKNVFTEKVEEGSIFTHKTDSGYTESYRDALLETKEGDEIQIGFFTDTKGFTPIIKTKKTTNKDIEKGYLNNLIENNILSDSKVKSGTDYYFSPTGYTELDKAIKAEIIQDDAYAYLGIEGVERSGYLFKLSKQKGRVKVLDKNGNIQELNQNELDSLSYEELSGLYENPGEIIAEREYHAARKPYNKNVNINDTFVAKRTEDDLQLRLLSLLSKMGVKVTSISNYIKNYNIKNGVNPSAKALADIANQVVAFQEGNIRLDELTEETAHFIVEALPRVETENVLRNINKSDEYKEFAPIYREIYRDEYAEQELEDVVRREVLGKIVANAIKTNFNTQDKSETQSNFITKVIDFLRSFFNNITNNFKPQYRTELDSYLQNVEDLLYAEDISNIADLDNFKENKYRLYSAPNDGSPESRIMNRAKKLVENYRDRLTQLKGSRTDLRKIQDIESNIEDGLQLQAVSSIASMAKHDVKKLQKAVEDAEKNNKSYFLSDEENIVYQNLIHNVRDTLSEIQEAISSKEGKDWKTVYQNIEDTVSNINKLKAKASNLDTRNIERLVEDIMNKHNLPEVERDIVRTWIEKADKDTSWFHATFGQMIHAKDGLLNVLGVSIRSMHNDAHFQWQQATKNLQQVMRDNGVSAKDISDMFFDNGFILSEYKQKEFQDDIDNIYAKNYKEVTKSKKNIEEILKDKREGNLEILTPQQESELRDLNKRDQAPLIERVFKDSYYNTYEEKLEGISQATKNYLGSYLADMATLKGKALDIIDGKKVVNFFKLSPQDREELYKLHRDRSYKKSYTDENGELKKGLSYSYDSNGEIQVDERNNPIVNISENASTEAQVAYDLNNMDNSFVANGNVDSELFYETIDNIDREYGREEAIKFLELNAYVGFKKDFWDNLGKSNGIIDKLRKARTPENSSDITQLINSITENNRKLKGILRLYQKKNSPTEISVEDMSDTSRDTVKTIQEVLSAKYNEARKFITEIEDKPEENLVEGVSSANDAYINELRQQDILIDNSDSFETTQRKIDQEIDFARKHMTDDNRKSVIRDISNLESFRKGETETVNRNISRALDALDFTENDIKDNVRYSQIQEYIIRTKLLPYYKRFAPEEYKPFRDVLSISNYNESPISEALRGSFKDEVFPLIEITPNYSFFDKSENNQKNENYVENYKGGRLQPKLSRYRNDKFYKLFGQVQKDTDGNIVSVSKNKGIFEVYKAYTDYHFSALDAMNVGSNYNYYKTAQIRKNVLDRFSSFSRNPSFTALKNAFKDFASFTEDDQAKGDTRFGDTVKVIPKKYTQNLENPEDVSNEIFYSTSLLAKEAYLRQSRVKHYGDIMSVYDKILTRDYNGKPAEVTQTYKMAKSAVDHNLFGIKEIRTMPVSTPFGTIDIAKIARNILSFIKFRNLGFNLIIPLTSYITGGVFQKIEVLQRDYLHPRSQKLGTSEFRKLSTEGIKELGKIDTTAKINVLGQYFRAFNLEDSLQNSNYGWVARSMPRVGMMLHTMANFPIYGKTLIGVLHDYRVVNGEIINFNSFRNKNSNLSRKDLDIEWSRYEKNVFYNYIDVSNGNISFKEEELKKALGVNDVSGIISESVNSIQQYVQNVNEFIDGQISEDDKVYASRDAMLNYFMTHRGWLSIAVQKRFKNKHLNMATGILEEGSYRSAWNFLGRYLKEYNGKNIKNLLSNGKELWDNSSDVERNNMKRVLIEMGFFNSLLILGFLLNKVADDDENKDIFTLQAMNYLTIRTLNEVSSSQLALGNNFSEIIDSPFVGWNTAKEMTNILDLFDSEEVKYGNYRGMTKRGRWITKMIPGVKQIHDLQNMNQTKNTYLFYNRSNLKYTPLGMLEWEE